MKLGFWRVKGICLMALLSVIANAAPPKAVFCNIIGAGVNVVPDYPLERFSTATPNPFRAVEFSPNGNYWALLCDTTPPSNVELQLLVRGTGDSLGGSICLLRQGELTSFDSIAHWGSFGNILSINDDGVAAITNLLQAPPESDMIVARSGPGVVLFAREGTQFAGMSSGITTGTILSSPQIGDSGVVTFCAAGLVGMPAGSPTKYVFSHGTSLTQGTVFAASDVTVPLGQFTGSSESVASLTTNNMRCSADGLTTLYQATLRGSGATNHVMVYGGVVVVQRGFPLPSAPFTNPVSLFITETGASCLSSNGNHYAFRGFCLNGLDWVYRDGEVMGYTGGPIVPGSSELFSEAVYGRTFFMSLVNNYGTTIVGGYTNNPDSHHRQVLIQNGTQEILRQGDPIDLDGDGLAEDNVYIGTFDLDSSALSNTGQLMFTATLVDLAGNFVGKALVSMQVESPPTSVPVEGYAVSAGVELSAPGIERLVATDGDWLELAMNLDQEDVVPVQVEMSGTLPNAIDHPSSFSIVAATEASDREMQIAFFDFDLGDWVDLPSLPLTQDLQNYLFLMPGASLTFVEPGTRQMVTRVRFLLGSADVPSVLTCFIDSAFWQ